MLSFIVLGIVPGTTIQLSFTEYVLILLAAAMVANIASRLTIRALRRSTRKLKLAYVANRHTNRRINKLLAA
jgi:hypothetical protein